MNCVPDFGKIAGILVLWPASGGLLYLIWKLDREFRGCNKKRLYLVWILSCMVMSIIGYVALEGNGTIEKVSYLLLLLYFIVCSVQDILMCMVSDFLQYIGLLGGCILILNQMPDAKIGLSLVLFGIMQGVLFMRMYGHADGMAFLVCALYLAAKGLDVEGYLKHMGAAFALLGIVQLCKNNISGRGNLKNPVALLPYIAVSFFLVI